MFENLNLKNQAGPKAYFFGHQISPLEAADEARSARVDMAEALKYLMLTHQGPLISVDLEHYIPAETRMIGEFDATWLASPTHRLKRRMKETTLINEIIGDI